MTVSSAMDVTLLRTLKCVDPFTTRTQFVIDPMYSHRLCHNIYQPRFI